MGRELFRGWSKRQLTVAFKQAVDDLAAVRTKEEELTFQRDAAYLRLLTGGP